MQYSGILPPTKTHTRQYHYDETRRVLTITATPAKGDAAVEVYDVTEHGPGDFDLRKRGEALPEGVEPTTYQVIVGRGCTCPDCRHRGRVCKHLSAFLDVAAQQKWMAEESVPF